MRLTESNAGLKIVEHQTGYSFVFKVQDQDDGAFDLVDQHWEGVGPAPESGLTEQEARHFVAVQARAQD